MSDNRITVTLSRQAIETGQSATSDDDGVRFTRFLQGDVGLDHDPIHGANPGRGAGDRDSPPRFTDTVQNTRGNEGVELVKTFEPRRDGISTLIVASPAIH
jgi:hypothetical protein